MRSPYLRFAVRDGTILLGVFAAWLLARPWLAGDAAVSDFLGVVLGVGVAFGAYVLHEWGHLLAGLWVGAPVCANTNLRSGFMFDYDFRRSTTPQFVAMSLGGFAMTAVAIASFYLYLPDGLLATRVARGLALFLAFLGVTLEVPLLVTMLWKGLPLAKDDPMAVRLSGPVVEEVAEAA